MTGIGERFLPFESGVGDIRACYEIGQHRDKKFFQKNIIFCYSVRFINVWVDKKLILYFYPMNREPSRGFQRYTDFGKICRTYTSHHIKFSDPINLAYRTYSQSSNYDKQSVKPSSYRKKMSTR